MQIPLITQQSASTTRSGSASPVSDNNNTTSANKLKVKLEIEKTLSRIGQTTNNEAVLNTRRGRFIVLGSSGECLPVKRNPLKEDSSDYTSCESSEGEFHSAKNSLDDGKCKNINARHRTTRNAAVSPHPSFLVIGYVSSMPGKQHYSCAKLKLNISRLQFMWYPISYLFNH